MANINPADEDIFEVVDPRGISVHCTKEVWYDHILSNRPYMEGTEDDIAEAIRQPFYICRDKLRADRNVYYALRSSEARYTRVVVEIYQDGRGRVITAFPADSGKSGEKMIWPQSSD